MHPRVHRYRWPMCRNGSTDCSKEKKTSSPFCLAHSLSRILFRVSPVAAFHFGGMKSRSSSRNRVRSTLTICNPCVYRMFRYMHFHIFVNITHLFYRSRVPLPQRNGSRAKQQQRQAKLHGLQVHIFAGECVA